MWRYLLQKGPALWARCCWSLLAQCRFVGLVIPFLLSYCIYSAISWAIFTQINAKVQWNLSPILVSGYSWVVWINLSFLVLLILQVQSLVSWLIAKWIRYFILTNVGYPLDMSLLKHVARQVPSLAHGYQ